MSSLATLKGNADVLQTVVINGQRYFIAEDAQGNRSWDVEYDTAQTTPPKPFEIQLSSFHEGCGFSYQGVPNVYERVSSTAGAAWDASVPGRLGSWARHAVGTSKASGSATFGFLAQQGGSLYMIRGRYVTKYTPSTTPGTTWTISGTDRDLGLTNICPGGPISWNTKLYVPVMDGGTGVLQPWVEITTASPDTYVTGPVGAEARCFGKFKELLVRGAGNGVATCAVTPTTLANWSDSGGVGTYKAGDPGIAVTAVRQWQTYLLTGKSDGLWSFDDNYFARNEIASLESVVDAQNAVHMDVVPSGHLAIPHASGLIHWDAAAGWAFVGPEQEGGLEADLSVGFGRPVAVIPYGRSAFIVYQDRVNNRSSIVQLLPSRGGRSPVPHMMTQVSGFFEGGCVVRASSGQVYLAVIYTSVDGLTATPWVWRLPTGNLSASTDPSIPRGIDDASFFSSRMLAPGRDITKTWRTFEFWCELAATGALSNTPGLQVWASVDGAASFQLLDSTGAAATIQSNGFQRLFFPKTASAVGHYVQLELRVPAVTGGQTVLSVNAVRDGVLRGSWRPLRAGMISATLILGHGEYDDRGGNRRTAAQQESDLLALAGPNTAPVLLRDAYGVESYVTVEDVRLKEIRDKGASGEPWKGALVKFRVEPYS